MVVPFLLSLEDHTKSSKMPTAGYSGTPLARKLGIKSGFKIWIENAPSHYFQLFDDLPEDLEIMKVLDQEIDFAHLFVKEQSILEPSLITIKKHLKKDGLIWISWPKGASKIVTDVNREIVREVGLKAGLVDVKVAAVDENWSGLKFVFRLKDR